MDATARNKEEILADVASKELTLDDASRMLDELDKPKRGQLYCKVSEKGGVSVLRATAHAGDVVCRAMAATSRIRRRDSRVPERK